MSFFSLPESLSTTVLAATLGVGLIAGFLNVVAGGGSLLAMPALIFLGLPPTVANGTVRVAILAQNIAAVARYRGAGRLRLDLARKLVPPVLLGAAAGAALGTVVPNEDFRDVLGVVMLGAAVLVIVGPQRFMAGRGDESLRLDARVIWPTLLVIGFYGGFIQAAVGYLALAGLTFVVGLELVEANIMKVVLIFAYTPIALAIFVAQGKVDFWMGALLAAGQALGGWIGAAVALKRGAGFIRGTLAVAVLLASLKLLGVLDWVG